MTSCNIIIILILTANLLWGLQLNLNFHCFHFKLYTTKLLFVIMKLNRNTKYFKCKILQCNLHISTYLPKTLHYFSFALAISGAVNEVNEKKFTRKEKYKNKNPCHLFPGQDRKLLFNLIHTHNVYEIVKAEKFYPIKLKDLSLKCMLTL